MKIWQRYREFKGGNFFWDTVYILCKKLNLQPQVQFDYEARFYAFCTKLSTAALYKCATRIVVVGIKFLIENSQHAATLIACSHRLHRREKTVLFCPCRRCEQAVRIAAWNKAFAFTMPVRNVLRHLQRKLTVSCAIPWLHCQSLTNWDCPNVPGHTGAALPPVWFSLTKTKTKMVKNEKITNSLTKTKTKTKKWWKLKRN